MKDKRLLKQLDDQSWWLIYSRFMESCLHHIIFLRRELGWRKPFDPEEFCIQVGDWIFGAYQMLLHMPNADTKLIVEIHHHASCEVERIRELAVAWFDPRGSWRGI